VKKDKHISVRNNLKTVPCAVFPLWERRWERHTWCFSESLDALKAYNGICGEGSTDSLQSCKVRREQTETMV